MLNLEFDVNDIPSMDASYLFALIVTLKKFKLYNSYISIMYFDSKYYLFNNLSKKTYKNVETLCEDVVKLFAQDDNYLYDQLLSSIICISKANFNGYDLRDYYTFYLDEYNASLLRK